MTAAVACFGDLLIDFVPSVSGLALADVPSFVKAPGGAAANVAVGLARLGVSSSFIGKVGDDPFGHFLADTLRSEGVGVDALRFETRARTALAFVSLREDGEREFLFYRHPSADMLFTPEEVDRPTVGGARIFHFDSISLASPQPRETALHAASLAQAGGKLISYDVNLRLPLWASSAEARAVIPEGLRRAAVVKLSDDELEFLTGSRDPEVFRDRLWHDGLKVGVVTMGGRGCVLFTPDAVREVPSIKVKPVDTTGAGDGFVAGLLAGLVDRPGAVDDTASIVGICRLANVVGALTTTARGAIPSLPTRAAVEAALAAADPSEITQ